MKTNQDKIEDKLIDALLTEQSREDREQALREIERAIDEGPLAANLPVRSRWTEAVGRIAAAVILGAMVFFGVKVFRESEKSAELGPQVSAAKMAEAREQERIALDRAIRNQEDKVEERRKVFATIVRTKGIIYRGSGMVLDEGATKAHFRHSISLSRRSCSWRARSPVCGNMIAIS